MMGAELCSARMLTSAFREESGDEELTVLPRHTKVIVTGNNRTKSVLVGLQGVVKKAVGLGGWHWLVLKNGVEVKLQRNALSVLEPPTGNEEDDEFDFSDSGTDSDIGENDDNHFSSGVKFSRLHNPRVRYARPWVQAAPPKSVQRGSSKEAQFNKHVPRQERSSSKEAQFNKHVPQQERSSSKEAQLNQHVPQQARSSSKEAQFNQHVPQQVRTINISRKQKMIVENLGTDSLWRYCQSYKLASINPDSPREQLVKIVQQHFFSQRVDEVKVVVDFVRAAKKLRTVDAH